jgi:hypothetical protein
MKQRVATLAVVLSALSAARAGAQVPNFNHVFVIVMENHEYGEIIGSSEAPFINSLAAQNGLATSDYAIGHPSLPNYMALTGGKTVFTDDCATCRVDAVNIADRIEASGRSWTAYMEDMPGPCAVADAYPYVVHHDPFVYYNDISGNATRCGSHVVPFSRFSSDLSSGALSNFVWITPNLCSDMHDCSIGTGDAWLAAIVPQIVQSTAFANSVLFVVWDEGSTSLGGGGHIPLITVSPRTPAGTRVTTGSTHYDLLRTIEDAWGLAPLGESANATALTAFFPAAASAPPTDQVIDAIDVQTISGTWKKVPDTSAAGGVKLSNADAGVAALNSPLAQPSNFFDATFQAVAGTRYRVWLRMHAIGDSKWNDSVFVQFSDSVDSAGSAEHRIGTSGGYTVNLWTCGTCQAFGWGWQRNAYWLADSGDVWFPSSGTHTIRVQLREDGAEIDQIVISPSTWVDNAPGAASNDTTIISAGGISPPPPSPSPSPSPSGGGGSLPSPWANQDIGATGLTGSSSLSNGVFTVAGAGDNVWGTVDAFQMAYEAISGDGQIVARVTSLQNTSTYAKAGIMIRSSTGASAAHVILDVLPSGNIEFMTRSVDGGSTSYLGGATLPLPAWLKLARTGTTITGYVSSNGIDWSQIGTASPSIGAAALAGLAVTSQNASRLNMATIDNVAVGSASGSGTSASLPAPWHNLDVGSTALSGTASASSGTFTIAGAGDDIWGTSDAFQFAYQAVSGDGQIAARVTSLQNTNTYAKAGVMLRSTTSAASAHVILDVLPNGGIEFMTRSSNGASTTYLGGASQSAPVWLKLARSGSIVTAYVSTNGTNWSSIGAVNFAVGSSIDAGLAVTSHDTGALNTATFDGVGITSFSTTGP